MQQLLKLWPRQGLPPNPTNWTSKTFSASYIPYKHLSYTFKILFSRLFFVVCVHSHTVSTIFILKCTFIHSCSTFMTFFFLYCGRWSAVFQLSSVTTGPEWVRASPIWLSNTKAGRQAALPTGALQNIILQTRAAPIKRFISSLGWNGWLIDAVDFYVVIQSEDRMGLKWQQMWEMRPF